MVIEARREKIRIGSEPENLQEVREFVFRICSEAGLDDQITKRIVQATDEAVTNIVNHAQVTDDDGEVEVRVDITSVRLRVMIKDHTNGMSRDISEIEGTYLEEAKRHKLGIFLIQQIMDEINYTFKKGFQNDLEMIRFLKN